MNIRFFFFKNGAFTSTGTKTSVQEKKGGEAFNCPVTGCDITTIIISL